jgi:sugar lactone lactonase YvrE
MNGTVQPPRQKILAVPYALKAKKSEDTQALSSNFTILQTQTTGLSSNLTTVQGQVNGVSSNVTALTSNVSALQGQTGNLSTNVATLQTQASGLASNVAQLQVATTPLTDFSVISTLADLSSVSNFPGSCFFGITIDKAGNVYAAVGGGLDEDYSRFRGVYKFTKSGNFTTVAGSVSNSYIDGYADGNGTSARFHTPIGIAVDVSGNMYVADMGDHRIRKITANGTVTTLAGSGNAGFADGNGTSASFNSPAGVAVDANGNVYVTDWENHRIRKITPSGNVTTLAGSGNASFADGQGTSASFNHPAGVAVDAVGNVYIADIENHKIRKITPSGSVSTLAGSGDAAFADGQGSAASFNYPGFLALDGSGNLYVTDSGNNQIRKITPSGNVTTIAFFQEPYSIAVDENGDIYVNNSQSIQKIQTKFQSLASNLSLVQGQVNGVSSNVTALTSNVSALQGHTGNLSTNVTTLQTQTTALSSNLSALQVATSPLTDRTVVTNLASGITSAGVAVDSSGNVYFADYDFNRILKIAASGNITSLAGPTYISGWDYGPAGDADGQGTSASFNHPAGVAVDAVGNVYVADMDNHKIRKITANGTVTTLGTAASFSGPIGIEVDASGNVYVADSGNNKIRKITANGTVTTLAGSGNAGFANGNGTSASFWSPSGVAVDASGNVYLADTNNHRIRKITTDGTVTTLAGSGNAGFADGQGAAANFQGPIGLAVDGSGNVYVADSENNKIRKITPDGNVTTLPVSGLNGPAGVDIDENGNLYVADMNNGRILKLQTQVQSLTSNLSLVQGQVSSVSSNIVTLQGQSSAQSANLTTLASNLNSLQQTQGGGNLSAIQSPTELIQALVSLGILPAYEKSNVATVAGNGTSGFGDGAGGAASFAGLNGVAVDGGGNVYLADMLGQRIRKVTPAGVVSTLAGSGSSGFADGLGAEAVFARPAGVAVDGSSNVYVADKNNNKIRKILANGTVTTLAGSGSEGSQDGTGAGASFDHPCAVAVDAEGNVYVADSANNKIRKITPSGIVTTLAGSGSEGSDNGTGANASFNNPTGVAVDGSGNVYVSDSGNNQIRKITSQGVVTTLAGSGNYGFAEGAGLYAAFKFPTGVAVDFMGHIYVADLNNNRIRKITPDGVVSTLAGTAAGFTDGSGANSKFSSPCAVAVGLNGDVYVADGANNRLRKITQEQMPKPMIFVQSGTLPESSGLAGQHVETFLIGKYEVTWAEWQEVRFWATSHGYTDLGGVGAGNTASHPVQSVSWYDVVKWCNAKSEKEGLTPVYQVNGATYKTGQSDPTINSTANGYRLPSEKEWEWAARGGVSSQGYTYSGSNDVNAVAWYDSINGTKAAGTKAANELGICDMSGNVWEWCWDIYDPYPPYRRLRGGGWNITADHCTVAYREISSGPVDYSDDIGFRLARSTNIVTTLAGSGNASYADGQGAAASFSGPLGIAVDGSGNLYVAEYQGHRIRKITANGTVTTLAGSGNATFADGQGTSASFNTPAEVAVDQIGNLYIADFQNNRIRKVTPSGNVTTLANVDAPTSVALDGSGNVYFNESSLQGSNNKVHKITPNGTITTLAGAGMGYADGQGTAARFNSYLRGLAVDTSGNIYVADTNNNRIRKIAPDGIVTTLAGSGNSGYADGQGAAASFYRPSGLAVDASGNVYVADQLNHRIRKITPDGTVTTIAGSGNEGSADGQGSTASFYRPAGVALDASGNLYVTDSGNRLVRKITISK